MGIHVSLIVTLIWWGGSRFNVIQIVDMIVTLLLWLGKMIVNWGNAVNDGLHKNKFLIKKSCHKKKIQHDAVTIGIS